MTFKRMMLTITTFITTALTFGIMTLGIKISGKTTISIMPSE